MRPRRAPSIARPPRRFPWLLRLRVLSLVLTLAALGAVVGGLALGLGHGWGRAGMPAVLGLALGAVFLVPGLRGVIRPPQVVLHDSHLELPRPIRWRSPGRRLPWEQIERVGFASPGAPVLARAVPTPVRALFERGVPASPLLLVQIVGGRTHRILCRQFRGGDEILAGVLERLGCTPAAVLPPGLVKSVRFHRGPRLLREC